MLDILQIQANVKDPTLLSILYSVILTFVLSVLIAKTYQKSLQGLSYSRSFIQALILGSLVTCIAMQAIGDNVARGFGMMGALAIIRFRSSIKDPKDIIFIFAALTLGIACGVYQFKIAAVGSIAFCSVALFLYYFPTTSENRFDGLLRFSVSSADKNVESTLRTILMDHCRHFALVTLRETSQGQRLDFAYQVKLKDDKSYQVFIESLKGLNDVTGVTFLLQEATVDI
jgi:uncharacterized membrane protein YhiD involved in acid resistance